MNKSQRNPQRETTRPEHRRRAVFYWWGRGEGPFKSVAFWSEQNPSHCLLESQVRPSEEVSLGMGKNGFMEIWGPHASAQAPGQRQILRAFALGDSFGWPWGTRGATSKGGIDGCHSNFRTIRTMQDAKVPPGEPQQAEFAG